MTRRQTHGTDMGYMGTRLQQLLTHVEQHGRAQAQQAAGSPARIRKQRVPEPHLHITMRAAGHRRRSSSEKHAMLKPSLVTTCPALVISSRYGALPTSPGPRQGHAGKSQGDTHRVWEGKILRQQQRDPPKCVELRVHLRMSARSNFHKLLPIHMPVPACAVHT